MKYLHIVNKNSFLTVHFTFEPDGINHQTKNHRKKPRYKLVMLLVKTFLIHNSRTKILSGKHFLQNTCQE